MALVLDLSGLIQAIADGACNAYLDCCCAVRRIQPTPCCPDAGISVNLVATFSNASGDCGCLNGVTVAMTYSDVAALWQGDFTACGGSTTLRFNGDSIGGCSLDGLGQCTIANSGFSTLDCATSTFVFLGVVVEGCCDGLVDITLTEA